MCRDSRGAPSGHNRCGQSVPVSCTAVTAVTAVMIVPIQLILVSGRNLLPQLGPMETRCSSWNAVAQSMVLRTSRALVTIAKWVAEDDNMRQV